MLPPSLRRVTFSELTADKATWDVLVTGLSRAHALDKLSWFWCYLQPSVVKAIAKSLPNWIHRGIRNISLDDSSLHDKVFRTEATKRRITYHVDRRTKLLVLESPVPHPQEL
ncbi:hypothetical protein SPRG_10541 [Saprolegnia parasitica CBS 223.65]|uniref:Uncharacterized protein n=1 Tax=Saprolegnia parasitica (strain CBS 223.65) TaxID=695850 RepID=A0A067BZ34_SAPPC|nr:hypothetical protein SPRG_10541 [Saprolegnia parasitica CBS 223.65]KDO23764.1 hypothetical protein SPRG_10541 [Saprolegnia parasitica CBS 223.65]|eukprot:XP_012205579.1 hypothetical protein SPRG_10541 [Saprolegnia parasitica CBS 223.65]